MAIPVIFGTHASRGYVHSMPRRTPTLTTRQQTDAARLRKLWESHKSRTGVTQEKFAGEMGWTQGALNHYLLGRKPLGLDAVLKLAVKFDVSPTEISPELVADYLQSLLGRVAPNAVGETSVAYNAPMLAVGEAALIYETRRLAERLKTSPDDLARKVIQLMRMLVVTPISDERLEEKWDASRKPPPVPAR